MGLNSTWVLVLLGVGAILGFHLDPDDLAYLPRAISPSHVEIQATDGVVFMHAVSADVPGPLKCSLSHGQEAIAKLLGDRNIILEAVGEARIGYLKRQCAEKRQLIHRFGQRGRRDVTNVPDTSLSSAADVNDTTQSGVTHGTFANGLDLPNQPFPPEKTGLPQGPGNSLLIFPGTKWCGEQNVASSYDDLGTARDADACCRAHDQCPYFIGPFQKKYNHRNPLPWTLSLCDCDAKLYQCLKKVGGFTAHEIGKGFFGVLEVDCFTFKTVEYCSQYHWSKLWCQLNSTGPAAVVQKLGLRW